MGRQQETRQENGWVNGQENGRENGWVMTQVFKAPFKSIGLEFGGLM